MIYFQILVKGATSTLPAGQSTGSSWKPWRSLTAQKQLVTRARSSVTLTTPFRRLLPRCKRGCCTEARRRRPARGLAPFPTQGWVRSQQGQTPQLSPLLGLAFYSASKFRKRKRKLEKDMCVGVCKSVVDETEQGFQCGAGLQIARSVFSFP